MRADTSRVLDLEAFTRGARGGDHEERFAPLPAHELDGVDVRVSGEGSDSVGPEEPSAEPSQSPSPFANSDVARWIGVEPRPPEFVIAGWNPRGMVSTMVGDGGSGKTMLMQSKATCIAAGQSWLGLETMPGVAFLLAAEDPDSVLHYRQAKINAALGVDMSALAGRLLVKSFQGQNAVLWDDSGPTRFAFDLRAYLMDIGGLVYVGIDNASLVFGANENDRVPVTQFLGWLGGLANELNVAIELSCHTSKSSTDDNAASMGSGSTAWVWSSRSAAKLKPQTLQGDPPELVLLKANHAKRGEKVALEWRDGILDQPAGYGGTLAGIARSNADREAEQRFMAGLDALAQQGRKGVAGRNTGEFAPKLIAALPQGGGLSVKALEHAMTRLFAAGIIEVGEVGRGPSRHPIKGIRRVARPAEEAAE